MISVLPSDGTGVGLTSNMFFSLIGSAVAFKQTTDIVPATRPNPATAPSKPKTGAQWLQPATILTVSSAMLLSSDRKSVV